MTVCESRLLLSMLSQIVLNGLNLAGSGRTEAPVLVDINQECVLKVQNHIRVMVSVDIHERECDRDQIRAGIIELWPNVDARYMEKTLSRVKRDKRKNLPYLPRIPQFRL